MAMIKTFLSLNVCCIFGALFDPRTDHCLSARVVTEDATISGRTRGHFKICKDAVKPVFRVKADASLEVRNASFEEDPQYLLDRAKASLSNSSISFSESLHSLLLLGSIFSTEPGAQLILENVDILVPNSNEFIENMVSCDVITALQEAACLKGTRDELDLLEVLPGTVRVTRWQTEGLDLKNVAFGCGESVLKRHRFTPPSETMNCAVKQVTSWSDLRFFSGHLQTLAEHTHIILADNITRLGSEFLDREERRIIEVTKDLRISVNPSLPYLTYLDLGAFIDQELWHVYSETALVTFERIFFRALPLGPSKAGYFCFFTWGMWAVARDSCAVMEQVQLIDSTIILKEESMRYIGYWSAELSSPFPDRREEAAWYGVENSCGKPRTRDLLSQQVEIKGQYTWIVNKAKSFGSLLRNTTLTSLMPSGLTSTSDGLKITRMFDDAYVPLTDVALVTCAEEFVSALESQATGHVLLMANISVPADTWPASGIVIKRSISITGMTNAVSVLDLQGVYNVIRLEPGVNFQLRNMWLINGGYSSCPSSWAANLTLAQVSVLCDRSLKPRDGGNVVELISVTVVVPDDEHKLLFTWFQQGVEKGTPWMYAQPTHLDTSGHRLVLRYMEEGYFLGKNLTVLSETAGDQKDLPFQIFKSRQRLPGLPKVSPPSYWETFTSSKLVLSALAGALTLAVSYSAFSWKKKEEGAISLGYPSLNSSYVHSREVSHRSLASHPSPNSSYVHSREVSHKSDEWQNITESFAGPTASNLTPAPAPRSIRPTGSISSQTPSGDLMSSRKHSQASQAVPSTPPKGTSRPDMTEEFPSSQHSSPHSSVDSWDSFDRPPQQPQQLLINRMEMSQKLQECMSGRGPQATDVAAQLKQLVERMQEELGEKEVEVTGVVGHGGNGVVYLGKWRGLTVAVKALTFSVLPMQPMSRKQHRAMTEAAICRSMQHPNIVATYAYEVQALESPQILGRGGQKGPNESMSSVDSATQGEARFMSMAQGVPLVNEFRLHIIQEFCDGGSLQQAVDEGRFHNISNGSMMPVISNILQVALDIAAGMAHVHARSVVHGDLTPANVLLSTRNGCASGYVAKVSDFGLSWKLNMGQEHVSNARQGTGFYIAPEVLHVGIMSKDADIFSFGMLLHEMYHGTPLWRRKGVDYHRLLERITSKRPGIEQLEWVDHCPEDFKLLICSCLQSDPKKRPSFFNIVEILMAMQRDHSATEALAVAKSREAEASNTMERSKSGQLKSLELQSVDFAQCRDDFRGIIQKAARKAPVHLESSSQRPSQQGNTTGATSGVLQESDTHALLTSLRAPWMKQPEAKNAVERAADALAVESLEELSRLSTRR